MTDQPSSASEEALESASRAVTFRLPAAAVADTAPASLMGWFHAPSHPDGQRECGVLLCPPLGYDAFSTHRAYRLLAAHLARQGVPVLRFDYHGTGDAAGDNDESGRVEAWLASIEAAGAYLQQLAGVGHLILFGVRSGGLLAAAAARRMPAVAGLMLWAPFLSGRLYVREMKALGALNAAESNVPAEREDGSLESGGFRLSAETVAGLSSINLLQQPWSPDWPLLLLHREDLPIDERLARHAGSAGTAVTSAVCEGYGAMMRDAYEAEAPACLRSRVADWLLPRYPLRPDRVPRPWSAPDSAVLPLPTLGEAGGEEITLGFGRAGALFGILTRPRLPGPRAATAALFLSVGANHHIGPHRQYVTLARALTARGFMALRFDMDGVGESRLHAAPVMEGVYDLGVVRDVKAAIDWLQSHLNVRRFVLVGICSGAYQAYHAAAQDARVTGVVLINPQVFEWQPGLTLKVALGRKLRPVSFYQRALWSGETWRRLVKGDIRWGQILWGLLRRQLQRLAEVSRQWWTRFDFDAEGVLPRFRRLLHRGIDTHLIYSDNDAGIDEMETHLGSEASRVRRHARFSLHLIGQADHTFTQYQSQQALQRQLVGHFEQKFGAGPTSPSQ